MARLAFSMWANENRVRVAATLPEGTKDKVVTQQLQAEWKELPTEERDVYKSRVRDEAKKNRASDTLLLGWAEETVGERKAWVHAESGALVWRKPLVRSRVVSGLARRGCAPGKYALFVKDNFKALGSMGACAAKWKELKVTNSS